MVELHRQLVHGRLLSQVAKDRKPETRRRLERRSDIGAGFAPVR